MSKNIEAYSKKFPKDEQNMLEDLRNIIMATFKFEECMYYNMPAFRYKGKYVAAFRMNTYHIGFYPCSGSIIHKFHIEPKKFKTSIGAVQFPKGKKYPKLLIKKLLRERMKEISQGRQ